MDTPNPMVSICMAAYNHEQFIGPAIESVMMQQTDFPIELVIGEDCSTDNTRAICERYAAQYPDKIKLLPSERNWGMSKNGIRIMANCRGKYIAILDGDDYWSDPFKLRDQVAFLEHNPEYGLVHSDVDAVDQQGSLIESEFLNYRRENYVDGAVFFRMLSGLNFVSSCSALFRHDLLRMDANSVEEYWFAYDFWYWQRISMLSKVYYMDKRMACYRVHQAGITNTTFFKKNRKRGYFVLYDVITKFYALYRGPVREAEKRVIFQKMISLLYRREGSLPMKLRILKLMPRYFPGISGFAGIVFSKLRPFIPLQFSSKPSH